PMELRRHFGAAAKYSGDAHFLQRNFFAERFEQLRRGKEAANVVVCSQQGEALLNYVLLVLFGLFCLALLNQLDDPTRIKIHHEANAAAKLCQMFDGEAQTARAGWSER